MIFKKPLSVITLLVLVASCSKDVNEKAPFTASITGQVIGREAPEAGVWVIAETDDLPSSYIKIVVTDDDGKFVLPEMPEANYRVWVRGYGLKDSVAVAAQPGETLALEAAYPATPQEAAQVYPASYWYSLLKLPDPDQFPGTGGNGVGEVIPNREAWVDASKQHCQLCHQLGTKYTRETAHLKDKFANSKQAWSYRLTLGQVGSSMVHKAGLIGFNPLVEMFADWSDRIEAGEVPPEPPRPQGIERNLVITMWDWGSETTMIHDVISTDKRKPTINANGPYYGVAQFDGELTVTDPLTHRSSILTVPMREPDEIVTSSFVPSLFYGDQPIITSAANVHNPMMDSKGRVWLTSSVRRNPDTPTWCQTDSSHSSVDYFPLPRSTRQASYFDPATSSFKLIDTCYTTHHLQFAEDSNETLWFSGDKQVIGWINTKKLDETDDEKSSQGWCPTVIDTNGDGKITKPWNQPGERVNPKYDTRIGDGKPITEGVANGFTDIAYGIIPNPLDQSVWVSRPGPTPGYLVRLTRGDNPPESCISEVYEPPFNTDKFPRSDWGYAPRGIDVDTQGVIWTALSGSGHLASFDRRKCKILNGPTATGQHCPEGWELHPAPGPGFKNADVAGGTNFMYYNWVDQFNTLGLGKNVPIANGTNSDALLALDPETKQWTVMRVPYPLGFYSRGLDGRIDEKEAGWKGSAVYANFGGWPNWHMEGGKGTHSKVVKFQFRPSPLAE